jgi:hypothetical protein
MKCTITSLAAVAVFVCASAASAAVISPSAVDDSGATTLADARYVATNLINGAHVAALGDAPTGPGGEWVTEASPPDYFANNPSPVLIFDMGADTDLGSVYLGAYTIGVQSFFGVNSQANSVADYSLAFATDAEGTGGFGSSIAFNPTFIAGPTLPTNAGGGANPQPVQTFGFGQVVNARYVEMTLLDNYFGVVGNVGGQRAGFAEIAFNTTNVPEPTTFGLTALGLLALCCRRRRRAPVLLNRS